MLYAYHREQNPEALRLEQESSSLLTLFVFLIPKPLCGPRRSGGDMGRLTRGGNALIKFSKRTDWKVGMSFFRLKLRRES